MLKRFCHKQSWMGFQPVMLALLTMVAFTCITTAKAAPPEYESQQDRKSCLRTVFCREIFLICTFRMCMEMPTCLS